MMKITDDMVGKALHWWFGTFDRSFYEDEDFPDMRKALEAFTDEEAINIWVPSHSNADELKVMSEIRESLLRTGDPELPT